MNVTFLHAPVLRALLAGFVMSVVLVSCKGRNEKPVVVDENASSEGRADNALSVTNAHMFELAPGQMHGAIYLVLDNASDVSRQLVDVATSVAGTAMVHRTFYEDGMMRMRHVHHLSVGPKQALVFEPNGYHIMLMDMEGVPKAGGRFVMDLAFDKGQSIAVDVEVKSQH